LAEAKQLEIEMIVSTSMKRKTCRSMAAAEGRKIWNVHTAKLRTEREFAIVATVAI